MTLVTTTVFQAHKRAYITDAEYARLVAEDPNVDRTITVDVTDWFAEPYSADVRVLKRDLN